MNLLDRLPPDPLERGERVDDRVAFDVNSMPERLIEGGAS